MNTLKLGLFKINLNNERLEQFKLIFSFVNWISKGKLKASYT
jgi:hypothetical protein